MSDARTCDLCGRAIPPQGHYVVRIDVFADPSLPQMSTDEIESTDFERTLDELMDQMKDMSAEELQDDVHRRFEFIVCRSCQKAILANPLGRPRRGRMGEN